MTQDPQAARTLKSIAEHLDMADKEKLILDDVPVKDTAFPLAAGIGGTTKELGGSSTAPLEQQHVVSQCPKCHSPIYGPIAVPPGQRPAVTRTCGCAF